MAKLTSLVIFLLLFLGNLAGIDATNCDDYVTSLAKHDIHLNARKVSYRSICSLKAPFSLPSFKSLVRSG